MDLTMKVHVARLPSGYLRVFDQDPMYGGHSIPSEGSGMAQALGRYLEVGGQPHQHRQDQKERKALGELMRTSATPSLNLCL